jgi:4-amino-4-deoxy-L-arabinose transferase-like glycosyltransferase
MWRWSSEAGATRWLLVLLCGHALMLAYGGWVHGPGWDEGGHLPAGISHWQVGNTDAYRVNPPLIRMLATAPLAWRDFGLKWSWPADTMHRPEWDLGTQFWKTQGRDAYWYLTMARWASIPWSLLAAGLIFCWSRRLYGEWAGLFSAALWCFSPLVLANAQMMTPDTGAAALGTAASLSYWRWLRSERLQSGRRAVDVGVLLGLAELSKFTWVILFVIWPAVWMVDAMWRWRKVSSASLGPAIDATTLLSSGKQLTAILGIAVLIVNVGYGFDGTLTSLGDYRFVSQSMRGRDKTNASQAPRRDDSQNRFTGTWFEQIPVPLPRNYVLGIDRQKVDFESDFASYLGGQWQRHGWWYYYGYGLLVKEPLGYLLLFVISLTVFINRSWRQEEVYLLVPAIIVFGLVSSQTGFNHHLRYILPTLPFVSIWMGQLFPWAWGSRWRASLLAVLMGTATTASLVVYPHSHAFFNVLGGGPLGGHQHLLDSNIDWGQDILLLADWMEANPNKPIDGIAYSLDWLIDRDALGMPAHQPPVGYLGDEQDLGDDQEQAYGPQPGRYAVFVRNLRESNRQFEYFQRFKPVVILGYTVYLYEISERDIQNERDIWKEKLGNASGSNRIR